MGCEACDSCMDGCELSFQKISDLKGKFYFRNNKELKKDDEFLTAKEWNSLITYIINGYELTGNTTEAASYKYNGKTIFAKGNSESNYYTGLEGQTIMTANMYNGALAKMQFLAGDDIDATVSSGDKITAEYFNDLAEYANEYFGIKNGSTGKYCENCQGAGEATYCCDESSGGGSGGDSCTGQCAQCAQCACQGEQCDCLTPSQCSQG